jgi:putative transposase
MARANRVQPAGGYFHVVARAVPGQPLFRDDVDRRVFLEPMNRVTRRRGWQLWAYCLMTTHYHVVVATPEADLSRGMQYVNGVYALRFNRRWDRFGHLFAERFASRLIESEEYLYEACRYVFDNPVRAGLCDAPAKWPWSGGRVFEDMSGGLTPI